jgi:hypothetical protein
MSSHFDMVGVIYPGTEIWRIKVRVLSMWTVKSVFRANQVNSVEMVLIDEKVLVIHLDCFLIRNKDVLRLMLCFFFCFVIFVTGGQNPCICSLSAYLFVFAKDS